MWDTITGENKKTLTEGATSISFSPDGKTIASVGENNTICLWNVTTGQKKKIIDGHTSNVEVYRLVLMERHSRLEICQTQSIYVTLHRSEKDNCYRTYSGVKVFRSVQMVKLLQVVVGERLTCGMRKHKSNINIMGQC